MSDTTLNAAGSGSIADTRLHDIVVGVDGSDESFAALRWALNEASLTGQQVNAVFAWSHSWDMGSEPEDEEQWAEVRHDIAQKLRDWVINQGDSDFIGAFRLNNNTLVVHP